MSPSRPYKPSYSHILAYPHMTSITRSSVWLIHFRAVGKTLENSQITNFSSTSICSILLGICKSPGALKRGHEKELFVFAWVIFRVRGLVICSYVCGLFGGLGCRGDGMEVN